MLNQLLPFRRSGSCLCPARQSLHRTMVDSVPACHPPQSPLDGMPCPWLSWLVWWKKRNLSQSFARPVYDTCRTNSRQPTTCCLRRPLSPQVIESLHHTLLPLCCWYCIARSRRRFELWTEGWRSTRGHKKLAKQNGWSWGDISWSVEQNSCSATLWIYDDLRSMDSHRIIHVYLCLDTQSWGSYDALAPPYLRRCMPPCPPRHHKHKTLGRYILLSVGTKNMTTWEGRNESQGRSEKR